MSRIDPAKREAMRRGGEAFNAKLVKPSEGEGTMSETTMTGTPVNYRVVLLRVGDGEAFNYGFRTLGDAEGFRRQMNGPRPDGLPRLYHVGPPVRVNA